MALKFKKTALKLKNLKMAVIFLFGALRGELHQIKI